MSIEMDKFKKDFNQDIQYMRDKIIELLEEFEKKYKTRVFDIKYEEYGGLSRNKYVGFDIIL